MNALFFWSSSSTAGFSSYRCSQQMCTYTHGLCCCFIFLKNWELLCLSIGNWMNELSYVHLTLMNKFFVHRDWGFNLYILTVRSLQFKKFLRGSGHPAIPCLPLSLHYDWSLLAHSHLLTICSPGTLTPESCRSPPPQAPSSSTQTHPHLILRVPWAAPFQ